MEENQNEDHQKSQNDNKPSFEEQTSDSLDAEAEMSNEEERRRSYFRKVFRNLLKDAPRKISPQEGSVDETECRGSDMVTSLTCDLEAGKFQDPSTQIADQQAMSTNESQHSLPSHIQTDEFGLILPKKLQNRTWNSKLGMDLQRDLFSRIESREREAQNKASTRNVQDEKKSHRNKNKKKTK